ncbi:MAG: chromate transporter [Alphaproteobacteria bacterium]|nr:chromate transporter [Alphaproteobacteria bacterium]
MQSLKDLFLLFFKIGLFTFGGGYAMLPLLKDELVVKRRLLSEDELLDLYAIGQCTPGIIAINVATFIGYRQARLKGAVAATLGMVFPSLLIITLIAMVLKQYMYNRYVTYAFAGIRIGVVALIASVLVDLWRKNIRNYADGTVFVLAVALLGVFSLSAVWVVIAAAVSALLIGEYVRK